MNPKKKVKSNVDKNNECREGTNQFVKKSESKFSRNSARGHESIKLE